MMKHTSNVGMLCVRSSLVFILLSGCAFDGGAFFDSEDLAMDRAATPVTTMDESGSAMMDSSSDEMAAPDPMSISGGRPPLPLASSPVDCTPQAPAGAVYYVDRRGSDSSGSGTENRPWATIAYAVSVVPDGATILVKPGTYTGTTTMRRRFSDGVVVRSEIPYQARLRVTSRHVMRCYSCRGITIEGFDIAHGSSSAGPVVVQIEGSRARDVTMRNNIIHDSFDNDLLKVNNGASHVTIERNLFYNQAGSDEHIDINSVADVVVQDNVFFNDFAASGRANDNSTSSYIVIKDSNGSTDSFFGAQRVTVRRNVFMNWEGTTGHNFVLVGEDGAPYIEGWDITVENNLFLGNSGNRIRAPLGVKSGRNVVFRNNTVSGDLPSRSFAMRLNIENDAIQNEDIRFYNNIWSDPTGTMDQFSSTHVGETASFDLDNNLYWNGGRAIPTRSTELINWTDDDHAITRDPLLANPANAISPAWDGSRFADGSRDICAAFEALVTSYGAPATGSPVINAARSDQAPDHDILGRARTSPDLGAFER